MNEHEKSISESGFEVSANSKELWMLYFMERPCNSNARKALCGPSFHTSKENAYLKLWRYVSPRISDCCSDEFIEAGFETDGDLVDIVSDYEQPMTNEELLSLLNSLNEEQIEKVSDWYFELMNDDLSESFYEIEQLAGEGGSNGLSLSGFEHATVLTALRHLQQAIGAGEELALDEYKVVTMSTAHLTEEDNRLLSDAIYEGETMVLKRDTGFFIKLYGENNPNNYRHGHSESIKKIIKWAIAKGYQMIEFDNDANTVPDFPVFDW